MKRPLILCVRAVIVHLILCGRVALAWTTVGDGIEFQQFVLPDPNNVFVARMARSNLSATIDSGMAQGRLSGGAERTTAQVTRYNKAINYWGGEWGQRSNIIVAINGDRFYSDGEIYGGQVHNGWYGEEMQYIHKTTGTRYDGSAFVWKLDRTPFIGTCLKNTSRNFTVSFPVLNQSQTANGLNRPRGVDELIIYTPPWDTTTKTDDSGTEIVVEMTNPAGPVTGTAPTRGHVREIRIGRGSTPISFDCVVLSATGSQAATLLSNVSIGTPVDISLGLISYEFPNCTTPLAFNWNGTFTSVTGTYPSLVLHNGIVQDLSGIFSEMGVRHPRTAVAYNDTYVYFLVCDGRDSGVSRGMTGVELGTFCKNILGATYALNLDGGGSSTMVVNGTIKNKPSDGTERSVGNSLMMVNLLPKVQSSVFSPGQYVTTTGNVNLRLGPGTNYGILATMPTGSVATIVKHSLKGINAKDNYWWKVDFNGTSGWMAEYLLTPHGTYPPSITEQPSSQCVCTGYDMSLSVAAVGSGTLSYRWQKNGVNLNDGGHYSGAITPVLTISDADSGDAAGYRCVVTGTYGSTTSTTASLTVGSPVTASIGPPSVTVTNSGPVCYTVTYAGADTITLSASHVTLIKSGSADGTVSVSGSGNASRAVTISNITGNGSLALYIAAGTALGCNPAPALGPSGSFQVDNSPPTLSMVNDQGTWTPSRTTLKATWSAGDAGAGLSHCEYAIGTSPGATDVKRWTTATGLASVTDSTLTLMDGETYYVQVRAVDQAGSISPIASSDGITVAPEMKKIGSAWSLNDSTPLSLRNKTVTISQTGAFWLQDVERSAGIKVVSSTPVSRGNTVSVAGVMGMSGAQRALIGDVVENFGGSAEASPLGVVQRDLGGASPSPSTPGVTGATSLYNTGLLAKCWGMVTYSNSAISTNKYFYLDDGSSISDGGPYAGVRVRCGTVTPPANGWTTVTGIVTSEEVNGMIVPVILIRNASDIAILPY